MTAHTPIEPTTILLTDVTGRPKVHLSFLDGLRGLAALYVMFHHAWLTVWIDPKYFPTDKTGWLTGWLAFGHVSVSVFIIISGFCLMMPVVRSGGKLRGGTLGFFKRRAKRILPPYYFALALSCLLLLTIIGKYTGTHWDVSIPFNRQAWLEAQPANPLMDYSRQGWELERRVWLKALATHLLLVHDFFDAYTLNHAFWSIPVEFQIYFLFPVFLILWRKRPGPILITAIVVAGSFWAQYRTDLAFAEPVFSDSHYVGVLARINHHLVRVMARLKQVNLQYVGLFTMGMLAATASFTENKLWCGLRSKNSMRALCAVCALATLALLALFSQGILWAVGHWLLIDFLAGIAVSCLMITACHMPRHPVRDFLQLKPVVWLGTFSYSLYLIHAPLLQVIWQYMVHPLGLRNSFTFGLLAALSAPIIPGCAYLFFLAFERPFLNTPPAVTSPL
jgi:peptidoglycan/LPS O-acetylase OafA/YrhL